MNFKLRLIALLVLVTMMFTSCSSVIDDIVSKLPFGTTTTEATTTTTTTKKPTTRPTTTKKPDVPEVPKFSKWDNSLTYNELLAKYTLTEDDITLALTTLDELEALSKTATTIEEIDAKYVAFEDMFYNVAQQRTIAMIIYYYNMSNAEAIERKTASEDGFFRMQDRYMEVCRTMYLESPFSAELFADWSEAELEELVGYDSTVLELQQEINDLEVQYDNLNMSSPTWNDDCAALYAKIVTKNNELAKLNGYDNYYDYATANVYGRDYERANLEKFREYVVKYVYPQFDNIQAQKNNMTGLSSKQKKIVDKFLNGSFDEMDDNYVVAYFNSLEGSMGEGMRHMFDNKNCVFTINTNSHPSAFQTYLYADETPFCLFGVNGQSSNTIVHEVGHYYAALRNNDLESYDLLETHSQGNEFLFLDFCKSMMKEETYKIIRGNVLDDMFFVIIIATIVDEFEQIVYTSENVASFKSADFDAIMEQVCEKYGGAGAVTSKVAPPNRYWRAVAATSPVYYISYAVSAIAAINLFGVIEEDRAAGIQAYTTLVEGVTAEDGFIGALEKAGLTTPFVEETFVRVAEVLSKQ